MTVYLSRSSIHQGSLSVVLATRGCRLVTLDGALGLCVEGRHGGLCESQALTAPGVFVLPSSGLVDIVQQDELAEIDLTEDEIDAMMAEGEPVVAANGEILATSAASYRSVADARKAASALTAAVREATIVDAEDTDDRIRRHTES